MLVSVYSVSCPARLCVYGKGIINMSINDASYDSEIIDIKQKYKEYLVKDNDLCKTLRTLGIGEANIVRIIEFFEIQNVRKRILQDNPYDLMELDGFGFIKADNVARQLGIQSEDPRRQKALIQSVLDTHKNFGHTFLPSTILEKECKKQNVHKFADMLKSLQSSGNIVVESNRIYSKKLHICEIEVAKMLKDKL